MADRLRRTNRCAARSPSMRQFAAVGCGRGRTAGARARCGPSRAGRRRRRPRRGAASMSTGCSWPRRAEAFAPRSSGARRAASAPRSLRSAAAARASRPTIAVTSAAGGSSAVRYSPTQLAVAQHRDAVGDRIHLVQEVGDEQDRHAVVAQARAAPSNRRATSLLVEARGRLVEDQHPGVDARARARSPPSAARRPGSSPSSARRRRCRGSRRASRARVSRSMRGASRCARARPQPRRG